MVLAQAVIVAVVQDPDHVLKLCQHHNVDSMMFVLPCASLAPGLISKFPGHNCRLVDVASDEGLDVVLECCLHSSICIKEIVIGRTGNLFHVNIHSTVVGPIYS
jgi:hypothetical protein